MHFAGVVALLDQLGGLLTYGPDRFEATEQCAGHADRILKGAGPGDLPIVQPTTFDFVVNLGTARTPGLTIPQSILLQATEIIR
jgi:putative ABC transport system substrate-binding protein